MSASPDSGITLLTCSVFEAEVRTLARLHWPEVRIVSLNSILHMQPIELAARMEEAASTELEAGRSVVLVYGDCHSRIDTLENRPKVARAQGINCCAILLGKENYRQMVREGAFFLLPEWTHRWREVFTKQLGLDATNAQSLMHEMHNKIVYLDTGICPVPLDEIAACAEHCGLPWEIFPVTFDLLRTAIEHAIQKVSGRPTTS